MGAAAPLRPVRFYLMLLLIAYVSASPRILLFPLGRFFVSWRRVRYMQAVGPKC